MLNSSFEFSQVSVKKFFWQFTKADVVAPRIVGKVPRQDFSRSWGNIQNLLLDPSDRNIAWRIAHGIVPVQAFLYRRNITRDINCSFCRLPETLEHAFVDCHLMRC